MGLNWPEKAWHESAWEKALCACLSVCVPVCLRETTLIQGREKKIKEEKGGGAEEIFLKDNQITKIYNAIQIGGEKVLFSIPLPPLDGFTPAPLNKY